MVEIIDAEKNRLEMKQKSVDDALFGQKRITLLNNSYRLRYADYVNIIVTITIALVIFIGISMARRYLTIIPSIVYDILVILLISVTCIIIYYKYTNILTHNKINYDELDYNPPTILSDKDKKKLEAERKTNILNTGDLLGEFGTCIGAQCCSGNTVWDNKQFLCINKDTFTTMNYALLNSDININADNKILPNYPNEFTNYSKI